MKKKTRGCISATMFRSEKSSKIHARGEKRLVRKMIEERRRWVQGRNPGRVEK